jgi:hypothetical protein
LLGINNLGRKPCKAAHFLRQNDLPYAIEHMHLFASSRSC